MDFKKYKRFFAFGCSLTEYAWPTWADIIANEIPESYNFGKSGAGNIFIASQIVEAHHRHGFNEHDLIMCMWSGFTREDRYIKHSWQTPGNIFTQNFYDSSFVEKYTDIRGYLLRDVSLISLTIGFLENLKVDYHMLNMMSLRYTQSDTLYKFKENDDILELFDSSLRKIKPDLATIELDNKWPAREIYHNPDQTVDYHPSTKQYYQYLQKVFPGIIFSKETVEFVEHYENIINNAKRIDDINWKIVRPKRF